MPLNSPLSRTQATRLAYLDCLRGLAAVAVVCSHYYMFFQAPNFIISCCSHTPFRVWFDGFASVTFFFVLSGFVLTRSTDLSNVGIKSVAQFLVRRIVRIWPPYLAAVLLGASVFLILIASLHLVGFHLELLDHLLKNLGGQHFGYREISNWLLLLPVGQANPILPQAWTLSIEILFSLAIPLFIFIESKLKIGVAGLGTIASLFLPGIFVHLFPFCLGYLLAKQEWRVGTFSMRKGALVLLVGFYFYTINFGYMPFNLIAKNEIPWHLMALGSGLIILAFVKTPTFQKIAQFRLFLALGAISYSVYLLHFFVVRNVMPFLMAYINSFCNAEIAWYVGLFVCLLITFVISGIFTKYIDQPIARFSSRIFGVHAIALPRGDL